MARPTRPQLFLHRQCRRHAAASFNIIITREEFLQHIGGGEPEVRDLMIRGGHRRHGDDRRAIIGGATERISSAEVRALVLATLGLLVNLIQIMYQNRRDSPFQTYPVAMAISLAAVCISGFATSALLNSKSVKEEEEHQTTGYFPYCHQILNKLVLISGVVALSCLLSVFIPNGVGRIVFISCASTISALIVGQRFLFQTIFGRTKFNHGELGPSRV